MKRWRLNLVAGRQWLTRNDLMRGLGIDDRRKVERCVRAGQLYGHWREHANSGRRDWVLTLPQTVEWDDYAREFEAVRDRSAVLNYRVHRAPKEMRAGDRCFLVWRGRVRGWMEVTGIAHHPEGFTCLTTGIDWPPGFYIQRSGGVQ